MPHVPYMMQPSHGRAESLSRQRTLLVGLVYLAQQYADVGKFIRSHQPPSVDQNKTKVIIEWKKIDFLAFPFGFLKLIQ